METLTLDLPALYGDHHVIEVRRILLALPGVKDVYASSCFHVVEVSFDPAQIDQATITATLEEAGYLQELPIPVETGALFGQGNDRFFRHTTAYKQTRQTVSFGQVVPNEGRPLWPCPGMRPIKPMDEQ